MGNYSDSKKINWAVAFFVIGLTLTAVFGIIIKEGQKITFIDKDTAVLPSGSQRAAPQFAAPTATAQYKFNIANGTLCSIDNRFVTQISLAPYEEILYAKIGNGAGTYNIRLQDKDGGMSRTISNALLWDGEQQTKVTIFSTNPLNQ